MSNNHDLLDKLFGDLNMLKQMFIKNCH